jgi:hypothetical protein
MLALNLTYILLNEALIQTVSLQGWAVFYAVLPKVHHVLLTALFRTLFWLTPIRSAAAKPRLTFRGGRRNQHSWRFVTGLRATLNNPLKRLRASPRRFEVAGVLNAGGRQHGKKLENTHATGA